MNLTKAIEKKYLKNPHFCPSCNSNKIVDDGWDASIQAQTVYCGACGMIWKEYYKLVSISQTNRTK